ncbi:MAG: arylesterase [Gemmatimonadaceae bacterium]
MRSVVERRPAVGAAGRGIGVRALALLPATLLWLTFSLTACGGGGGSSGAGRGAPRDSAGADGAPGRDSAVGGAAPATAASGAATGATTGCASRPRRVLMMGTSLTAGLGLDPEQAYPALLQRKADSAGYAVQVVNAGESGETSAGARRRADWILREPLDVFVLETGANDGLRGLDPDSTRANVRSILEKARAAHPDARLLLVQMEAPPNLGADYTARFRAMFPEVARASGATLVPFLLEGVAGKASLNQGDGIHPNVVGERRVAANVWPSLEGALRALDPCPKAQ